MQLCLELRMIHLNPQVAHLIRSRWGGSETHPNGVQVMEELQLVLALRMRFPTSRLPQPAVLPLESR